MPSALEILLIFGALMLFFGGRKIPEMARNLAEARRAFDRESPDTDEESRKSKREEAAENWAKARQAYEEERDRPRRSSTDDPPSNDSTPR